MTTLTTALTYENDDVIIHHHDIGGKLTWKMKTKSPLYLSSHHTTIMWDDLYHTLAEQVDDNPHFLVNAKCIENKRLIAHAMSPRVEHKILYEEEQQNNHVVEKEYIVYLIGRSGTCADRQRVGAAGATPADVPVRNEII